MQRLQFFARFESDGFAWRNRYFRTCAGIAANPGLARFDGKNPETTQLDTVSVLESPLHFLKNGFDGHFRLGLGDTGLADDFIDDIELNQAALPEYFPGRQTDDRIRVISMSSKGFPAGGHTAIDASLYRRTCSLFATGITVITTVDENAHPHGMTVNSFSSVSLDPPLVLVSIDLKNAILGHFMTSAWFAVNILGEHQEDLSRRFSTAAENRFNGVDWQPGVSRVPLLAGVLAQMECAVIRTFEAGDHALLIGEVRSAAYRAGKPLVYFNSSYQNISERA